MTKRPSRGNGHAERSSVGGTSPSNGYQSKKKWLPKQLNMERWRDGEKIVCVLINDAG